MASRPGNKLPQLAVVQELFDDCNESIGIEIVYDEVRATIQSIGAHDFAVARRIAACLNASAGISTEELEARSRA